MPDYFQNTMLYFSYSHDNAKRFLWVQLLMNNPMSRNNIDIILLGEKTLNRRSFEALLHRPIPTNFIQSTDLRTMIFKNGFSDIVYIDKDGVVTLLARSPNAGSIPQKKYRVIHQAYLNHTEVIKLRKISQDFSAATGDQSYCEAIASAKTVVYEQQEWKKKFAEGMYLLAKEIDEVCLRSQHPQPWYSSAPRVSLAEVIRLLANANNYGEYSELAELLKNPEIQQRMQQYKLKICEEYNLYRNLSKHLDVIVRGPGQQFFAPSRIPTQMLFSPLKPPVSNQMKNIIIFCYSLSDGYGDLYLGSKVYFFFKRKYPQATIEFITSSRLGVDDRTPGQIKLKAMLDKFNQQRDDVDKLIELKDYRRRNVDLLVMCPLPNFSDCGRSQNGEFKKLMSSLNVPYATPIWIIPEYDSNDYIPSNQTYLSGMGYTKIYIFTTGLNEEFNSHGIFTEYDLYRFPKNDSTMKLQTLAQLSEPLKSTLLAQITPEQYLENTELYFNYSHKNAERFLLVQLLMSDPESQKNVDIILLGEKEFNFPALLSKRFDSQPGYPAIDLQTMIFNNGFSDIVYIDKDGVAALHLRSPNTGSIHEKTYRIIHRHYLDNKEILNLRKLAADFSGCTGDQSYCEAIATSSVVIYESLPHKREFLNGMMQQAEEVDSLYNGLLHSTPLPHPATSTVCLVEVINLLAHASDINHYRKLAGLLKNSEIQQRMQCYKQTICERHNLYINLENQLDHAFPGASPQRLTIPQYGSSPVLYVASVQQRARIYPQQLLITAH